MMLRITLGWWQESPVHQGEREASRKTIRVRERRAEPVDSW